MFDFFQKTSRPAPNLFFRRNDANDPRLGEIISFGFADYENAEVVILGCPQDEGVARNHGRIGAALAPDAIRAQFYKLTTFGVSVKVFDAGDTIIQSNLEATHDLHTQIVEQLLRDEKKLIVIGGGNDVSFADGSAISKIYGTENWLAFNIDAHFDVRADYPRNSGTPYRQLLENFINPRNFYEFAYQTQVNSPVYFEYLKNLQVNLMPLETLEIAEFESHIKENVAAFDFEPAIFFGFDVDAVRAADAPGTSAPSPFGLSAQEFVRLAEFAGSLTSTKIIEFTEVNPNYDIDNRTAKLVAAAMHQFLRAIK